MEWTYEEILEFLRLYEQEPIIWNPKHPLHRSRENVSDAWRRIRKSLSVPRSIDEMKKKKESLMASFRPLYTKVRNSISGDNPYKPDWFAYETMERFLKTVYQPRSLMKTEVRL